MGIPFSEAVGNYPRQKANNRRTLLQLAAESSFESLITFQDGGHRAKSADANRIARTKRSEPFAKIKQ